MEKAWYVVHTYSGYENKVKTNLEKRVESMGMEDKIFRVLVPTEEEVETKDGKKRTVTKKVFPGYVLVEMVMTDDSWYVVRNTPGVTGFVGSTGAGSKPTALLPEEADTILRHMGIRVSENQSRFRSPRYGTCNRWSVCQSHRRDHRDSPRQAKGSRVGGHLWTRNTG